MAELAPTSTIAPRSAVRYRPLGTTAAQAAMPPAVARASRLRKGSGSPLEKPGDETTPTPAAPKSPTTARTTTAGQASTRTTPIPVQAKPIAQTRRIHPLLFLGVGMLLMLALWTGLSFVITWGQTTLNDWRYGRPRTFQIDQFVGHNEQSGIPSHFIALNLNRHIQIIELPGGDPTHVKIYSGPTLYGPSDDLVPVTLSFADVNGDHKPDMIVHIQETRIVFINDGRAFQPLQSNNQPAVERYLQQHPHT